MVQRLTFSSVDNPEIPVLVHILGLSGSAAVQVNEVVGRAALDLDGANDARQIILTLGTLDTGLWVPKSSSETALFAQWLSFALDTVAGELRNSHNFDTAVLGPLHCGLERKVFLAGSFEPSLVDWLLFSMLFNRIVSRRQCGCKRW
jgi:hypothetical protein